MHSRQIIRSVFVALALTAGATSLSTTEASAHNFGGGSIFMHPGHGGGWGHGGWGHGGWGHGGWSYGGWGYGGRVGGWGGPVTSYGGFYGCYFKRFVNDDGEIVVRRFCD